MVHTHSTLFTIYIATALTLYFRKEFEHAQKVKTNVYQFQLFFNDEDNKTFWLSGLKKVFGAQSIMFLYVAITQYNYHNYKPT